VASPPSSRGGRQLRAAIRPAQRRPHPVVTTAILLAVDRTRGRQHFPTGRRLLHRSFPQGRRHQALSHERAPASADRAPIAGSNAVFPPHPFAEENHYLGSQNPCKNLQHQRSRRRLLDRRKPQGFPSQRGPPQAVPSALEPHRSSAPIIAETFLRDKQGSTPGPFRLHSNIQPQVDPATFPKRPSARHLGQPARRTSAEPLRCCAREARRTRRASAARHCSRARLRALGCYPP